MGHSDVLIKSWTIVNLLPVDVAIQLPHVILELEALRISVSVTRYCVGGLQFCLHCDVIK